VCRIRWTSSTVRITGRRFFDVLDVQEILPEFFLSDEIRRFPIVLSELAHGPDVGLLRARRQTLQLQVVNEALSECGHRIFLRVETHDVS